MFGTAPMPPPPPAAAPVDWRSVAHQLSRALWQQDCRCKLRQVAGELGSLARCSRCNALARFAHAEASER